MNSLRKKLSPDEGQGSEPLVEGSATLEDHEARTLALGVCVVTDDAHVMVGVSAMASLERTDHNGEVLLTEEGQFPIGPIDGHGIAGMDVLDERAPTLGNDVSDLV